jgi:transcriptional regulator with XRE-family HTH domain
MSAGEASLGATIRAWRDRLTPAAAGLPAGRARRAAGLRREDLAELAGVSVDYIVRLEQGRATTPSAQIVSALALALQLTRQERDHLYRLAGLQPPQDGAITDHIPPGMQRVLTRLGDTPVAVFAADWRLVWWNRSWAALLGDPSGVAPEDRNLVKARFPVGPGRSQFTGWPVVSENGEATDRAVIADLRRATARYPSAPGRADPACAGREPALRAAMARRRGQQAHRGPQDHPAPRHRRHHRGLRRAQRRRHRPEDHHLHRRPWQRGRDQARPHPRGRRPPRPVVT